MIEIQSPNTPYHLEGHRVFLAGTIDMGNSENWQQKVVDELTDTDVILLNPRRDDWDSSWVQSIDNVQFNEQVTWELTNITHADTVIFYFAPDSVSPITLMELGYVLGRNDYNPQNILVCCPEKFWRKGNVDIMCKREGVQVYTDIDSLISNIRKVIK
jgi:hypothetical protein